MPPETTVTDELWKIRERLRLARDHMDRAQQEMERALLRLGPLVGQWFFSLEESCDCGMTPTVGVLEIYEWINTLNRRCKSLYDQTEDRLREPLIQLQKRGSHRGPTNWLDRRGSICRIPLETELPKISPAPKGVSAET